MKTWFMAIALTLTTTASWGKVLKTEEVKDAVAFLACHGAREVCTIHVRDQEALVSKESLGDDVVEQLEDFNDAPLGMPLIVSGKLRRVVVGDQGKEIVMELFTPSSAEATQN